MFNCESCKGSKQISEFYPEPRTKLGHTKICRPCKIESASAWSKANRKKTNAYKKAWAINNPEKNMSAKKNWKLNNQDAVRGHTATRRARIAAVTIEPLPSNYMTILKDMYKSCLCCGSTDNLSLDHVISIARGGSHSMGNFQLLCMKCNQRKGAKEVDYRGRI